jgi:hypothetical protein
MILLPKMRNLFINCRQVSKVTSLAFVILPLAGCAIDDIGLVKVRHYENRTMHMVSKEAWGAYLSTSETDGGLVFGHAERLFVYPKNRPLTKIDLEQILSGPKQNRFREIEEINFEPLLMQSPVAWISNNQGLIVNANPQRVGFAIGLESRDVVKLPGDFNGIFIFGYNSAGIVNGLYSPNPF